MKKWHYIFVFILFSNCSNSKENKIVTNPKVEIKEQKDNVEKKNNIPENFPKNYVVEEWYPSAFKGSYVFYENGNYIFVYGGIGKSEKYDIGKWKLNKNIISIHIKKEIGLRPIGKPTNPEVSSASNPEEYYEYNSYEKFENLVDKTENIDITNFLTKEICYINKKKKATDFNIKIEDYLNSGKYKITNRKETSKSLKNDLEKYNGFYSSIETNTGKISLKNLPSNVIQKQFGDISTINLEYLEKKENGFVLLYDIKYHTKTILVVSTLDENYKTINHLKFTNGTNYNDYELDTIAIPVFNSTQIIIEQMRPNPEQEPEFLVDGIVKETINIDDDLKFVSVIKSYK